MLRLPSGRLLQYYKNSVPQKPGLNEEVLQWMEQEAAKGNLTELGKCGGIILDEMSIQVPNDFYFSSYTAQSLYAFVSFSTFVICSVWRFQCKKHLHFTQLLRQSGVQKNTFITRQTANGRFTPGFTYNSMPLDLHVQLDAANPRRYLIGRLADEKDRWMHKACGPCESRWGVWGHGIIMFER